MRKIRNFGDKILRKEQFEVLSEVIGLLNKNREIRLFLNTFLTESELVYLGQRMNIIRMLAKGFKYVEIEAKLKVPSATITRAKNCFDKGGPKFKDIILAYRYTDNSKPVESIDIADIGDVKHSSNFPRMPGSII